MQIHKQYKTSFGELFTQLKLIVPGHTVSKDKEAKVGQIVGYLEIIHSCLKKYSAKRKLTLVECGAGNCYLSFLVYYFYTKVESRKIHIHCIDINTKLMEKCKGMAEKMGFDNMTFHADDIQNVTIQGTVDMTYSLHACDIATDKSIYLGVSHGAKNILAASCCQHSLKKDFKAKGLRGITRHHVYNDRMTYMVSDALRSLLLEDNGYKTDVIEFISTRATGKNTMIRATTASFKRYYNAYEEYLKLSALFNIRPTLETYIAKWKQRFTS